MEQDQTPLVLLADDDLAVIRLLEMKIQAMGFRTQFALDKGELMTRFANEIPQTLVLDLQFGQHNGLEVLRQILDSHPHLPVLILTSHGSIEIAVHAMKIGARDFLTKPPDWTRLSDLLGTIRTENTSERKSAIQKKPKSMAAPILLGTSPAMKELHSKITEIARTDATVLLSGESGTGKELVARLLHLQSNRATGPFIAFNMATLPPNLAESTLFGHEKGAFSGADQQRIGCCEAADRGTLFLDEIGEMELGLQAKLLRFIQERTVQRVGSVSEKKVDVRFVAATNRNLQQQVAEGSFRNDLYFRLDVIPLWLPPLRERGEDILLLADHFFQSFAERYRRQPITLSPEARSAFLKFSWPGNVRQLVNVVERLVILHHHPVIGLESLPVEMRQMEAHANWASLPMQSMPTTPVVTRRMEDLEKNAIVEALQQSKGNVRDAAKQLGLGQATVYRKIKLLGITLTKQGRFPLLSD